MPASHLTQLSYTELVQEVCSLFIPQHLIPRADLASKPASHLTQLSYTELVQEVCSLFIPQHLIPRADLAALLSTAFSRFPLAEVVHVARLKDGLRVVELWHGATLAFKDLAMSCVGQFLRYFVSKLNRHVTIVVGTSGDTGSSAIESVRGMEGVDIIVTFPKGHCTPVQELQMTTIKEGNVHVFAADGTSDDIDVPIRKLFSDAGFVEQHGLMSLNSVNWARIMVQVAHFFYAYFQCAPSLENSPLPEVEIVVPTGGAGNITAGCVAVKMGLPVRLVAVVNENDIIHRAVQLGDFSLSESVKHTLAPAIDIQDPYNMERVFWLLSGMDSSLMKGLMEEFYSTGKLRLPPGLHKTVSEVVSSRSVTDRDIVETMRRCWEENRYLLCPHTAVAVHHHYQQQQQQLKHASLPRCCLATASAAKFQDAVLKAGLTPEIPAEIRALETMVTHSTPMRRGECWEGILREKIELISSTRKGGNSV
ncbi:threonine synthase-like 2 isoform X1 [Acipenser oxyrinchus oxyrinchus]|uniref:Threonine synthase-like 2 n=1 Tax=Acipenser oxyrinchus oxyrinchus TaxID=40147 RepID=A0AAD8GLV5_ACIOX|nr:threonine synthase-like 2 isoform X1 [Acipenser oxyrinchus oxyrinchus]